MVGNWSRKPGLGKTGWFDSSILRQIARKADRVAMFRFAKPRICLTAYEGSIPSPSAMWVAGRVARRLTVNQDLL